MVADYNYTKPRRPIAAMFAGPGPAAYNIPTLVGRTDHDPRSVHFRYPAYQMGIRLSMQQRDFSPGPIYYPNSKMLRDGMEGSPKYSLTARRGEKEYDRSPGPAAYFPTKWAEDNQPPAYSFGVKHADDATFLTPAPNEYTLPRMIGQTVESSKWSAPCYSMATRSFMPEGRFKIPGPGAYKVVETDVYKMKPPHYSMTARNEPPGDRTLKPGPGTYYPENVVATRRQMPQYTFGIKHSPYSGDIVNPSLDEETTSCGL